MRNIFLDVSTIITGKFLSINDCSENNFSSIGFSRIHFVFFSSSIQFRLVHKMVIQMNQKGREFILNQVRVFAFDFF